MNESVSCNHIWDIIEENTPTCIDSGSIITKCRLCGENSTLILAVSSHTPSSVFGFDGTNHWNECSVCKNKCNSGEHVYTTFTEVNKSYHIIECSICDYYCNQSHSWNENDECTICGARISDETTTTKERIEIWVSEKKGVKELTKKQIEAFLAANPSYGYTIDDFVIEGVPEADAASQVLLDVKKAPDLYCFAQDQMARLVQASALAPLGVKATETVTANNDAGSVAAVTVAGKLYAYPMTSDNGYYLYYDKTVISDPTSLNQIVADCENAGAKFHFEVENGWYAASFFFGVGCESVWETDDKGNFVGIEDTFDDKTLGVIAMKGVQIVTKSECYYNSSFFEGTNIAAIVTGTWNAEDADDYFGENLGVCKLPSFTVDGETYQLGSFSGFKLMGVKPQTDANKGAFCAALAQYLTGEECQLERYNRFQWGPSNLKAQATDEVKSNPSLVALQEQSQYAIPQGYIPNDWWSSAESLAKKATICVNDAEIILALQEYRAEIESILS
jgi:arabinogalactan oligomer/maltooligosaccharide transport system substrate-binding protein